MDVRDRHAGGSKRDGSGCDHGALPGLLSQRGRRSMTQTLNLATVSEITPGTILGRCAVTVFDKTAWCVCLCVCYIDGNHWTTDVS